MTTPTCLRIGLLILLVASGNAWSETANAPAIETARVTREQVADELRAPGEVEANSYATVLVTPRMSAEVLARHAKLGDHVRQGQRLVTLTSIELAEAQGALVVAERDWQRVKALGTDAVSGRRYLEAQVARDQALAKARAFGMTPAQAAALTRTGSANATGVLELIAPRTGRITSDAFVVGERVEPGRTLFTIVDTSTVWVDAQVPPADATRIAVGAVARVTIDGAELTGRVTQRVPTADETTRKISMRLEFPNPDERLVPGQFVEARIGTGAADPVLVVPTTALTQVRGEPVVFKLEPDGGFEPTAIKAGGERGRFTVIEAGLSEGETVAVSGVYALKTKLLRSQIGDDDD